MRTQMQLLVASSMALLSYAGAAAQENPYGGGTRLTGPPPIEIPSGLMSQQDKARLVTQRLAACLIREHRKSVLKAIEPEPWQPQAGKMLADVVDDRCLDSGELAMPPSLLRGAFYQQFYREKFSSAPPALPAVAFDFTAGTSSNLTDEAKTDIALRQFGDCVARRDLKDAHALLLATPGSVEETSAVTALLPHFSGCLVQGSRWTLNRSTVSAILSEVLYREGMAAQVAKKLAGN